MKTIGRLSALLLFSFPLLAVATSLDEAAVIEGETIKAAASSQRRVDASDASIQSIKAEIERLERDINDLTIYRDHLEKLVRSQEEERASLTSQVNQIAQTRQGVIPFMYGLLNSLEVWIDNDLPFNQDARRHRVEQLQNMMTRADVSDAEKVRLLLDAYLIELDYGRKLGVYRENLFLQGRERDVDVLHLGRMSLIARSLRGDSYWFFSDAENTWVEADNIDADALKQAFDVASGNVPPAFLTLPMSTILSQKEG